MLNEKDINERAKYCYLVYHQLCYLQKNEFIDPIQYIDILEKSSLGLKSDNFIRESITRAISIGDQDGGLNSLVSLYEGFVYAFCEILEINIETLVKNFDKNILRSLEKEIINN